MTDAERSFLAAIRAAPNDNLPRLVYADWLDETGEEERAAFVRMNCGGADPDAAEVARLRAVTERWVASVLPPGMTVAFDHGDYEYAFDIDEYVERAAQWEIGFDRGLPDSLSCPGEDFLTCGPDILATFPITSLSVVARTQDIERITALPCMEAIESIRITSPNGAVSGSRLLHGIAAGQHFHKLHSISSCSVGLGPEGVEAFAASPWCGQIEWFSACCCGEVDDRGMAALARGVSPDRFRSLDLMDNDVTDAGLTAWAASPRTAGTTDMRLSGNNIGDAGLAALAASPFARTLTHLNICNNAYGDAGLAALARSESLTGLERLNLGSRSRDVDAGLVALAAAPNLRLRALSLWFEHAGPEAWHALSRSAVCDCPDWLHLRGNWLSSTSALESFLTSPQLTTLQSLIVHDHGSSEFGSVTDELLAGDRVAQMVAESFALPALRELSLNITVGVAGVNALLASPRLPAAAARGQARFRRADATRVAGGIPRAVWGECLAGRRLGECA